MKHKNNMDVKIEAKITKKLFEKMLIDIDRNGLNGYSQYVRQLIIESTNDIKLEPISYDLSAKTQS